MIITKNKWNAALAIVMLTSVLTACSGNGVKTGTAEDRAAHESAAQTAESPSASASAAPTTSLQPSQSPAASPAASKTPLPNSSSTPASTAKSTAAPSKQAADAALKKLSWYYLKKKKGQVPGFPAETKTFTANQKTIWVGTGKKIYLTFDTGGPLGDVDKLLKTLKDNDVKVNFFLAGYNVKAHPDFLKRLVEDGHLVANHTMSHKDMTTLSDDQVKKEIMDYEKMYQDITGKPIKKFFRFPYGIYSRHLLDTVAGLGYTSVFWSTAMKDWEPRPNGPEDAYNDVINNLHDGNIILLHQGSQDNIDALDRIIKEIKKEGYEFGLLTDFN